MNTTNLLILIGNIGQDPRQVGSTVKLSVATNRSWSDQNGQRKTATDWVTVTIFGGKTADFVLENVRKGDVVSIKARVADGSYERDGNRHFSTDVIAETVDLITPRAASAAG